LSYFKTGKPICERMKIMG